MKEGSLDRRSFLRAGAVAIAAGGAILLGVRPGFAEGDGSVPEAYRVVFTPVVTSSREEHDAYERELTVVNNRLRQYNPNFRRLHSELGDLWSRYMSDTVQITTRETEAYKEITKTAIVPSFMPNNYFKNNFEAPTEPFNTTVLLAQPEDPSEKPQIKFIHWISAIAINRPYNESNQAFPYFTIGADLLQVNNMRDDIAQRIEAGMSVEDAFNLTKDKDYRNSTYETARNRMNALYGEARDQLPALGINPLPGA